MVCQGLGFVDKLAGTLILGPRGSRSSYGPARCPTIGTLTALRRVLAPQSPDNRRRYPALGS